MNITPQDRQLAERIFEVVYLKYNSMCPEIERDVFALLAEAREAQHKASWLPIETAPKGVPIHTFGTYLPRNAHASEMLHIVLRDDELSETSPYWHMRTYHEHDGMVGTYTRTHWYPVQPLPTPPITDKENI